MQHSSRFFYAVNVLCWCALSFLLFIITIVFTKVQQQTLEKIKLPLLRFSNFFRFQYLRLLQQQISNSLTDVDFEMSANLKAPDKERTSSSRHFSPKQAEYELTFRVPMRVTTVRLFQSGDTYAVCPKCQLSLTREFMAFCDVCGQKLSWRQFGKAEVIRVPLRTFPSD